MHGLGGFGEASYREGLLGRIKEDDAGDKEFYGEHDGDSLVLSADTVRRSQPPLLIDDLAAS